MQLDLDPRHLRPVLDAEPVPRPAVRRAHRRGGGDEARARPGRKRAAPLQLRRGRAARDDRRGGPVRRSIYANYVYRLGRLASTRSSTGDCGLTRIPPLGLSG